MKVTVIPVVVGALETIPKGLVKGLEDSEVRGLVENIQTTALLKSGILGTVMISCPFPEQSSYN